MPISAQPDDRIRLRPLILWSAFAALLLVGVVLWFRFNDRITPMLDTILDR